MLHLLTFEKLLILLHIANFGLSCLGWVLKEKCYRLSRACRELLKLMFTMETRWLMHFFCWKGLKQGEITSPLLFSLFINDIAADIIKNWRHGIQLLPDMIELFILLFADDIVLFWIAKSVRCSCSKYYETWSPCQFRQNKHCDFQKWWIHTTKREIWYYNGQSISVVNSYKYLGIFLTTRMTFSNAVDEMANKARKGVTDI